MTPGAGLVDLIQDAASWAATRARVFRRNRRLWQVGRMAPVRIADARAGALVKISGRIETGGPLLMSPFTRSACVFWEAKLNDIGEEALTRAGSDGWTIAAVSHQSFHEATSQPFFIADESGRVRVEPAGALTRIGLHDVSDHARVNDGNEALMAFLASRGIRAAAFMGVDNSFREAHLAPGATVAAYGTFGEAPTVESDGYRDRSGRLLRLSGTAEAPLVLLANIEASR